MIPEREKLIGARLRAFREMLQVPRARFAASAGFGSERIAAYEAGRARLPYFVFRSVSDRYFINPFWLVEGTGASQAKNCFDDSVFVGKIPRHAVFTEIYDRHLATQFELAKLADERDSQQLRGLFDVLNDEATPEKERLEMIKSVARPLAKLLEDTIKSSEQTERVNELLLQSGSYPAKILDLTNVTFEDNNSPVKAKLPTLLKRLNEATSERGTKTALAKFMGVKLPNISQWLSGAKEPSGETTLKLLHWVEQQERQK